MTAVETPAPATGPLPPPRLQRPRLTLACAAVAGILAAALVAHGARAGLGVVLCGLVAVLPAALASRRYGRVRGALALVAAALALTPVLRDSAWLVAVAGGAALVVALVVIVDARRWAGFALALPQFALATAESLLVARDAVPAVRVSPSAALAWVRGLLVAAVLVPVVGVLLISSDDLFADVLMHLVPAWDWRVRGLQLLALAGVAVLSTGAAHAAARRRDFDPDRPWPVPPARERHPAEYLVPLVLTSLVLALYIAVEVSALFAGDELLRQETGLTYAGRAHQGFGQLIAVTVLMAGLLGWAGRSAAAGPPSQRRLLSVGGGVLLGLTALVAFSAVRRLWLYQSAYGWTVRRLLATSFESWLLAMLFGLAALWLLDRTDLVPRLVLGSAGLGILTLALAGPDAVVAHADVVRYAHTGKLDRWYVAQLSADAVPALDRLPEPARTEVLAQWRQEHPQPWPGGWRSWNLARTRAAAIAGD